MSFKSPNLMNSIYGGDRMCKIHAEIRLVDIFLHQLRYQGDLFPPKKQHEG